MNQHKMEVIKEEFGDDLATPLEGWSFVTRNTTTSSSSPHSPSTSQSVSNQPSPPAFISNHPSTSTSGSSHVKQTYTGVAFVRVMPPYARQGLVNNVETNNNNNRPFIAARNNFVPIGSSSHQTITEQFLELQLKQSQELLKAAIDKFEDNRKAYKVLEEMYHELQLANAKLHDENKQLKDHQVTVMAQIDAQTQTETSQSATQLYSNEDIVDDITNSDQMYNLIEIGQNDDSEHFPDATEKLIKQELSDDDPQHCSSLSDATNIQIKQEFKEEFSDDDFKHCPARSNSTEMQIKQEFSDDDFVSNEASDNLSRDDQLNSNNNSVSQCTASANEHFSPSANGQMDLFNNLTDESGYHELIGANVDQQYTQILQSNDSQANTNEVVNGENGLIDEKNADLSDEEAMSNKDCSAVESDEPSTSAQQQSNRIAPIQPTGSNCQSPTKRKQSQSNRSVKKSKKTVEDEDEQEEEIANEDRVEDKFKVVKLNCTEQNCQVELDSLDHLYNHLRTAHGLGPLRCFAQNCNSRFDQRRQIRTHIELHHLQSTQFLCSICPKEFDTQTKAFKHWYYVHLTGQFKCNFVSDCTEVSDTRNKMKIHLQTKHLKNFVCTRDGCSASFAGMFLLKQHESSHLNSRPFHCNWTKCNYRSNRHSNLLRHIRKQHFGLPATMKEQAEKNIVDERDPNEYVRVVEEPIAE